MAKKFFLLFLNKKWLRERGEVGEDQRPADVDTDKSLKMKYAEPSVLEIHFHKTFEYKNYFRVVCCIVIPAGG